MNRQEIVNSVHLHPHALCESDDVGDGTRVWAFAHVMPGARIGTGCNICDHSYIEGGAVIGNRVTIKNNVLIFDGVTIEDEVFVGPGVVFTNDLRPRIGFKKDPRDFLPTMIRRGATIGAGAVIVCGRTVGPYALVAAGSVVTKDVPPHVLVAGNPARAKGLVCVCTASLGESLYCDSCGRRFSRLHGGGLEPLTEERSDGAGSRP